MHFETVPNRHSPRAVLLREGYREGGKIEWFLDTLLFLSVFHTDSYSPQSRSMHSRSFAKAITSAYFACRSNRLAWWGCS